MIFTHNKQTLLSFTLLTVINVSGVFADTPATDSGIEKPLDETSHEQNLSGQGDSAQGDDHCVQEFASDHWVDKTQAHTFTGICKTVRWFDGLFGNSRSFNDDEFGGKIVVGFKQREDDGFDEKVRIRLKTQLPNLSSKADAFIGRVNEDEFISDGDQNPDGLAETAIQRRSEEDDEWLIGLGYNPSSNRKKGFDYSIGAKISSGLNPYAKIRYRYNFKMPENHFLRATQTIFWRNDDGYGTTTNLNYSFLAGLDDILEWGSSVKFTEDEDQWEWVTGTNWYHRLQNNHAIVSRVYVRGEEENSESIPEYGVNLTYRRPFLREWLFLEALLEHRWIRENADEPRETSIGAGLAVTMEFGLLARQRLGQ